MFAAIGRIDAFMPSAQRWALAFQPSTSVLGCALVLSASAGRCFGIGGGCDPITPPQTSALGLAISASAACVVSRARKHAHWQVAPPRAAPSGAQGVGPIRRRLFGWLFGAPSAARRGRAQAGPLEGKRSAAALQARRASATEPAGSRPQGSMRSTIGATPATRPG